MAEQASSLPQAKFRSDYQAPAFLIEKTDLNVNLHDTETTIQTNLVIKRNGKNCDDLVLDSEVETIDSIYIDGDQLPEDQFQIKDEKLVITVPKDKFFLTINARINPLTNLALDGLYKSGGVFCTQCEAEGFRKITPYLDRPDVLSVFTVTVTADGSKYPHVLANGNLVSKKEHSNGNVTVVWHDPFPKPSYLFALVAGDFDLLEDTFTTASGKNIALELYVDKGNLHLSHHAMSSLKKSMLWDEQKYGLEYDLDSYMIVAVDFFNMGAMENKGLNVFNSKYVLADEKTATDTDYHGVEAVIAHEYFHNWTGNRVTCRDWFQLSLKEGLTVFRDQQFSADMGSPVIERISHANVMRTMQFAEDSGPMSHPIRPDKVIEMNNFYTVTVYDKGAEVIRMFNTLLGETGFRKGMDLYFQRHDGQAVTCDDFVAAMQDANGKDLSKFSRWYSQSGTPKITVVEHAVNGKLTLDVTQEISGGERQGLAHKPMPLTIPIKLELLSKKTGQSLLREMVVLEENQQSFVFDVNENVDVVLFEDFSAPVKVNRKLSVDTMVNIINNASDPFCRWDMLQSLWQLAVNTFPNTDVADQLITTLAAILNNNEIEESIKSELIAIPSFQSLAEGQDIIAVDTILKSKQTILSNFANQNIETINSELFKLSKIVNGYEAHLVAKRSLKSRLLMLLSFTENSKSSVQIKACYDNATNMTERMAAINAASHSSLELLESLLSDLEVQFSDQVLVFDKALQAVASINDNGVYDLMDAWSKKSQFDRNNPNRMRSLYGAFVMRNPAQFHAINGKGYTFLSKLLLEIDANNPQLAARMIDPLLSYKRYENIRAEMMKAVLTELSAKDLSKDLFEKVNAALS